MSNHSSELHTFSVGDIVQSLSWMNRGWKNLGTIHHIDNEIATIQFDTGVIDRISIDNLILVSDDGSNEMYIAIHRIQDEILTVLSRLNRVIQANRSTKLRKELNIPNQNHIL